MCIDRLQVQYTLRYLLATIDCLYRSANVILIRTFGSSAHTRDVRRILCVGNAIPQKQLAIDRIDPNVAHDI